MAKDTFYFPHDYNARNDDKTVELIEDYGSVAYGEYWIIAEILHEEEESKIELTDRFYRIRSKAARMDIETYKKFIDECCSKYQLMINENGFLRIARVDRNKEKRMDVRIKRSQAGKAGMTKRWAENNNCYENDDKNITNVIEPITLVNNKITNDNKERKVKEIKESTSSKEEDINISPELKKKYEKNEWYAWPVAAKIIKKKEQFREDVRPFIEEFGKDLCIDFWYYWTQPTTDKSGKIAFEKEKKFDIISRLRTFRTNKNNSNNGR